MTLLFQFNAKYEDFISIDVDWAKKKKIKIIERKIKLIDSTLNIFNLKISDDSKRVLSI